MTPMLSLHKRRKRKRVRERTTIKKTWRST
jgi:hypothetical protein